MNAKHEKREVSHSVAVSDVRKDGTLIELIYDRTAEATRFAVFDGETVKFEKRFDDGHETLVPVSASNNLIRHEAVLLPDGLEAFGTTEGLVDDIQAYLYKYVDLSEPFARLATWYVLLTWVYDAFNELPYLRLRGDYGSGKSRALTVIGGVAYKAFFASGASTVSPIFHTLDTFRGTLIFDEADFRFTDEKSELVKILNNGNVRGFPVLRTAITLKKEFDPRAFLVFGPKIVAMRGSYDDQALESRFLTEEMGQRPMRRDIPINLPDSQKEEARHLRNRLLDYRFRNFHRISINASFVDQTLSPRMNQILVPLLSIVEEEADRARVREAVASFDGRLTADRTGTAEAGVLEVLVELSERTATGPIHVSVIADSFIKRYRTEYERPITNKFVGGVLRKRLRILTVKSHGVYVVPESERPKIREIAIRYGVLSRNEEGTG